MTRREWLLKNPPPRAAKQLRELLEKLVQENNTRGLLESNKVTFGHHIQYWQQTASTARAASDVASLNHANAQIANFQQKLVEIDKQLLATAGLSAQISTLKEELVRAATCPVHKTDLVRHAYRPEDLFTCEIGPHFFIWTREGAAAKLCAVDITKTLPAIDEKLDWL